METKAFDNGYVGYRVNTIKEVVNAQAAGLKICNENGYYFDGNIDVVNPETGEDENRAPTDDEILQSIQEAMENEYPVYATFYLDCGMVVDNKATTLQSSFYVGQRVFYIKNNKIQSKYIFRILLAKTVTTDSASDDIIIKEGEESCIRMNYKGCNAYVLANKKFYDSIQRNNCIKYYQMEIVTESEIFASKEELVKHLLED